MPPLGERLEPSIALAKDIARYGGACVVLIHPNILGHKLEFEKEFIAAIRSFSWFGSLEDYGYWWRTRNDVSVDTEAKDNLLLMHLSVPHPIAGLTLKIPEGFRLDTRQKSDAEAKMSGGQVVLGLLDGKATVHLVRK